MVGPAGLEPATSSTPRKRATTCATARRDHYNGNRGTRECGNAKRGLQRTLSATEEVRVPPSPSSLSLQGQQNMVGASGAPPLGNRGTRECGNARKNVVALSGGRAVVSIR